MLDIYLRSHLDELYALIKRRALVQYASPYTRISLATMATAFGMEVPLLERELAALVLSGELKHARIDVATASIDVGASARNPRDVATSRVARAARQFKRLAGVTLVRASLAHLEPDGADADAMPGSAPAPRVPAA